MYGLHVVTAALVCAAATGTPHAVRPSKVLEKSDARLPTDAWSEPDLPVHGADNPDDDHTLAPYFASSSSDDAVEALPLKATSAEVEIAGVIAHVRLKQTFENTGATPIEAVYVFPASTRAAVHGMRMKIGSRTIEARLEKRQKAREDYEAAKSNGQRASLLEQQRPNVFTTQVANLMPRDRIEVELEYSELLIPEDATYELVIPTVVGPRYGGGADPQKDQWIANPYTKEGEKESYAFDVTVSLQTGLPLHDVQSPSHPIDVAFSGQDSARVTLKEKGGGNRDFVLRYRLADEQIAAGVLLGANDREKFFSVIVEPPARVETAEIVPREYVFVVDVSGSMSGFPLDTAKALMRKLLGGLRETDHVNVVLFSGAFATLAPKSMPATPENVARAIAFVDASQGGGGTELMGALRAAYAIPAVGDGVSRSVVVVTDGYVGVEAQVFKFVREHLDSTNLFAFGIGSSVNRGLIEGLARAGSGEPYVVLNSEKAPAIAERFRAAIERPVLTDIHVRFKGFDAREVAPDRIPDLMANRPLVIFGKYEGAASGEIEVTGSAAGAPFSRRISVADAAAHPPVAALQWLWARRWIELLEDQYALTAGAKEVEDAITDLGLSYRMLTPFTSFVAIDTEVVNKTGKTKTVKQPLPLPQGVSDLAVGDAAEGKGAGYGASGVGYGMGASASYSTTFGGGIASLGSSSSGLAVNGRVADSPHAEAAPPTLRMDAADADVEGSLDSSLVLRDVRRHQGEVRACYEKALKSSPELKGKITLELTIGVDGKISKARIVSSTVGDLAMETCVVAAARRWTFPAPQGGEVTFTFPWIFVPGEKN